MNNRWQTITLHFFRARPLGNALYIADWLLTGRQIECLNCDEEWLLCYFMVLYFTLLQCIGAPSGNVQAIRSLRCSLIHPFTHPLTWHSLRHVLLYLKKTTCYVCVCVCVYADAVDWGNSSLPGIADLMKARRRAGHQWGLRNVEAIRRDSLHLWKNEFFFLLTDG